MTPLARAALRRRLAAAQPTTELVRRLALLPVDPAPPLPGSAGNQPSP